ncbi:MAG TPA: isoprenylcysteine carboxylmethyltransferase family protein [Candidatus Xenobia bacterium]|jgi:protein-S-isoprenylcysteine O-methyltransferase Ste14
MTGVHSALCLWIVLEVGLQIRERAQVFHHNTHHQQTLVGFILLGALLARALQHTPWTMPGDTQNLATLFMAFGLALRLFSILWLGRFFRLTIVVQDSHRVVNSGPYRWIRHPSYTGFLIACIGYGVSTANWASLMGLMISCLIGFHYRIKAEEQALQEGLGEDYRAYMQHTWRLFPGLY